MALPTSRNRVYAEGDPIYSADLNDLQDQVIALETARAGLQADLTAVEGDITTLQSDVNTAESAIDDLEDNKHGSRTLHIHASAGSAAPDAWTVDWAGYHNPTAGLAAWTIPIPLLHGDRILSVSAHVRDKSGSTNILMALYESASGTDLGDDTSDGSGNWQTLLISGLTITIAIGEYYAAYFTVGDDVEIRGVSVVFDHP